MKTKILISLCFILPVIVFYFTQPNAEETSRGLNNTPSPPDSFLIGSTANGSYMDYAGYRKANMNLWHIYEGGSDVIGGKWYPAGWVNIGAPNDRLFSDSTQYISDVQNILRTNAENGLTSNMMRPKIQYLSYGQHSEYQAEDSIPEDPVNNSTDWFYSYRKHYTGININDNQTTPVRFCDADNPRDSTGYVVMNLKANRELCNEDDLRVNTDHIYDWYFLPQIKIPQGLIPNTQVCRIDVVSWDSVVLKSWVLTAGSFNDGNGNYSGDYIKEFNLGNNKYEPLTIKVTENLLFNPNKHGWTDVNAYCKFDIRVYWFKQCDMWIDYIKVENEVAYTLLTDSLSNLHNTYLNWIQQEAQQIGGYSAGAPHIFYIEEVEYNNFPCIKYVDSVIKSYNSNMSLVCVPYLAAPPMNGGNWYSFNKEKIKSVYQYLGLREFYMSYYPLHGNYFSINKCGVPSYIPNTFDTCCEYNDCEYDLPHGNLGVKASVNTYEANLQDLLDNHGLFIDNGLRTADYISKELNIPFIFMEQAHLWLNASPIDSEKYSQREPTNEELEVMADIALTYGAKGITYFAYDSWGLFNNPVNGKYSYGRGLMENPAPDTTKRYVNVYGQNKWQKISDLNAKLKKWGPYLVKFNSQYTNSCIYHNTTERNSFLSNSYFADIITYKPGTETPDCEDDNPGGNTPTGLIYECYEMRYLQAATFKISSTDLNKYFMIVNRRCAPYIDSSTEDNRGGRRNVRIRFDINHSEFANYNNWKITDLETNNTVLSFDKTMFTILDLGWYMPGEGKLYKISPVIVTGGDLVCDENVNSDITIGGMIYGNGYNFVINEGKTVTFKQDAGIEMNGGVFVCGVNSDNAAAVTLKGEDNNNIWNGLVLNNCDSVGIYNTNITNIKANDTAKAVLLTNCYKSEFRKNTITANNNSGGIQAVFNNVSDDPIILKIRECNFYMNQSGYSAINLISNASVTLPLNIEWCIFNTQSDTSNAVMLSEVTGGVIKNNLFSNFGKSAVFMLSTVDLYGNVILGRNNSQGIQCLAGSSISLSPSSGMYLGGYNYFRNYGSSASNIYSDNSIFYVNNGQNDFDLDDLDNSLHLSGTLSGNIVSSINATKNCFQEDSVYNIDALSNVYWSDSSSLPVNFIFTPYSCELTPLQDYAVFEYNGYHDTVFRSSGGEGGGLNKEERDMSVPDLNTNPDFAKKALKPLNILNIEENNYKALRDSININLRKRNYAVVEQKAIQILSQFPDSSASMGMIPKLYISMLNLDTGGTKAGQLKSFLENLITNNTQNIGLVKSAFYHIQKCKVKLGQYQSALDGFQYIMTQNPYSYEGLIASWDYAATYLLMGSGGISNNENLNFNTEEELNTPADTLINRMINGDINSDRNSERNKSNLNQNKQPTGISNEQSRKEFYEKIKTVNKDSKTIQEEKVKTLEKKIETAKDNKTKEDARTELTKMKQINEAVKIKKPDNLKTHTIIINNDIRKVFGIGKKPAKETSTSTLPKTFELYQNYPNPFNPVTKIAFDLPRDARVKLVIYDILGREVKTIINNEFRVAGKYISEFNGSGMASGIYFARTLVNDGKEFVAVKKMVLIK